MHQRRRRADEQRRDERRDAPVAPLPRPGQLSAADLGRLQRTLGNAAVGRILQRYAEVPVAKQTPTEWNAGGPVRVADDGSLAVRQDTRAGSHHLWAEDWRIEQSNARLKSAGSVIQLKKGSSTITGSAPHRTATLFSVEPENSATATSGTTMEIWADCGKSARDVIGVGGGSGKNYSEVAAVHKESGKAVQTDASSPKAMADEIMEKTLGSGWLWDSAADGWKAYAAMSKEDREKFDAEHGINKYVQPSVGEGFTMASGGRPHPGKATWNFHWAGVVMTTGVDHVTLENYSVSRPMQANANWKFQLYGSADQAGQTFHEQHEATQQHGDRPTTMHVRKRR